MSLDFRRGSPDRPRGHAIVYFQASESPSGIVATYVVIPPIAMDLGKYLPPMFAGRLDISAIPQATAMPLPPVPEAVESIELLERWAEVREDDLLYGGTLGSGIESMMAASAGVAHAYQEAYQAAMQALPSPEPSPSTLDEFDVNSVMYELMSDTSRVSELAKLAGKLRYAVECGDNDLAADASAEVDRLGRYLGASYRINDFLRCANVPGEPANTLVSLFVERAYKLAQEDYSGVARCDEAIRDAEGNRKQ